MKKLTTLLLIISFSFSFNSCDVDSECIADIAVTTLDAPAAVLSGDIIGVVCVIKNIINTTSECTESGSGTATITCAYNSEFQSEFKDYQVFDTQTVPIESLSSGDKVVDDPMPMRTDLGPGYYAMQVQINSDNDNNDSNNSRAVAIRAN